MMTILGIGTAASPIATATATSGSCSGYANWVVAPDYIYVLRQSGPSKGHSVKVDFRSWAKHVLGTQMPGYYPRAALRANALYVKQYGWYYALKGHWRGGRDAYGKCYDLKDAGDGWYVPETHGYTTSQSQAMDDTWAFSVRKWSYNRWRFVLTGYRAGAFVSCGVDSDGWHLMQHSAYDCGKDGHSWQEIVHKYLTHSWLYRHS